MKQQMLNHQISLVLDAGQGQQMLISNFFGGGAGSSATNANASNFFGFKLVWVQQMLIVQISWLKCWF
jgi:hypothetical protein